MTNQAAQTMPEPVTASMCQSSDYAKGWNDCLAALSQTAGVVLARGWFHALPDEDDYEFHDDASGAGKGCAGCIRAMIVPESAAVANPPQPSASVSEWAREIVPVGPDGGWCTRCGCGNDAANFAHLPSCNAKTPDVAARAREILIGLNQGFLGCKRDNEIITKGNAYDVFVRGDIALRALEQALTQQRVCATCGGRGEIGGHVGQTAETFDYVTEPCPECTTPQPSADAVRELVQRWRELEESEAASIGESIVYGECADELESLLARGAE